MDKPATPPPGPSPLASGVQYTDWRFILGKEDFILRDVLVSREREGVLTLYKAGEGCVAQFMLGPGDRAMKLSLEPEFMLKVPQESSWDICQVCSLTRKYHNSSTDHEFKDLDDSCIHEPMAKDAVEVRDTRYPGGKYYIPPGTLQNLIDKSQSSASLSREMARKSQVGVSLRRCALCGKPGSMHPTETCEEYIKEQVIE